MDERPRSDLIAAGEAKRLLGLKSYSALYEHAKAGHVDAVRIGRTWRFSRASIEAHLRQPVRRPRAVVVSLRPVEADADESPAFKRFVDAYAYGIPATKGRKGGSTTRPIGIRPERSSAAE